jgi:CubicO group peptidase (beta-lactamase class C family)
MNKKNILPGSLFAAGAVAFVRLAFARVSSAKPTSKPSPYTDIDAYIEAQMRRLNIPGASLAIIEGDQITHLRGFTRKAGTTCGHARPGGEAPSPQTPFFIGSLTKSFTALAVMQLVEAGKVELDAPVQRYLPWFRVAPPRGCKEDPRVSALVTVRHLLNQTSGLPLLPGWQLLSDYDDRPGATERQARTLFPLKLNRLPGAAFEYSNVNYNLLGLIIEAASGESYPAAIQRHIFEPLEMNHSHTSKAAAKRDGLAVGHQSWFGVPVAAPDLPLASGSLPSGLLISSAEDMGRYLIAHLNGGRCGDAQILSPKGIAELHRPAVEAKLFDDGAKGWYGMGWFIEEHDQTRSLQHSGLVPDYYACMALLPEQKKGVVLLVNVDHFTMQLTMSDVSAGLVRLLAGKQPTPLKFSAIPWVQRGLLLIPALQLLDVAVTLGLAHRWRTQPRRRPNQEGMLLGHILLPLIPNLLVLLTLIPILGKIRGFLMLFAPDFSWIARISGGFAGIWIFLRTALILRTLKNHRSTPKTGLTSAGHVK